MKNILIVEDEKLILWALGQTLGREKDYQIHLAQGVEEALELMKLYELDLIITDIKLPGKSGWEIIEKAKELSPGSKSIVISAYLNEDFERHARIKGASCWFEKPIPLNEIKDRVKSLL